MRASDVALMIASAAGPPSTVALLDPPAGTSDTARFVLGFIATVLAPALTMLCKEAAPRLLAGHQARRAKRAELRRKRAEEKEKERQRILADGDPKNDHLAEALARQAEQLRDQADEDDSFAAGVGAAGKKP